MKSFTDPEYWELLNKLVDEQYDDAIDNYDISGMEWVPAEIEIKKKLDSINRSGMIDLTTVKSSLLKEEIKKSGNLKVGNFKVTLSHVHPDPVRGDVGYDLSVRETKMKTPSGQPCNGVDYHADLTNDSRFKGRPWLRYFKDGSYARNMPIDSVVEMIRWMQAVKKLTAFL